MVTYSLLSRTSPRYFYEQTNLSIQTFSNRLQVQVFDLFYLYSLYQAKTQGNADYRYHRLQLQSKLQLWRLHNVWWPDQHRRTLPRSPRSHRQWHRGLVRKRTSWQRLLAQFFHWRNCCVEGAWPEDCWPRPAFAGSDKCSDGPSYDVGYGG